METRRFSIEHPNHPVPDDVAVSNRNLLEDGFATLSRQEEIALLAQPDEEERAMLFEVRESVANARGINADMLHRLRESDARKFDRVVHALEDAVAIRHPYELPTLDGQPTLPLWTDPTFWWARTDGWMPTEGFNSFSRDDGLHFTGGVTRHNGDLHTESFAAVALFELQAERIPRSLSNRWLSTPHVELFGGLLGRTGDEDIFTGDLWSKCWLHRDQEIYQMALGANGPVPLILGKAHEFENLIFEEDGGRPVHVGLRGFQFMPPLMISNINPRLSLWARLEVRFDIQTEGAGSLLWADPEVLVRTFQWPLNPL